MAWAKLDPREVYFWSLSVSGGLFFEFVGFVVWAKLDPHGAVFLEFVGLRRRSFLSLSVSWSEPN